MYGATRDNSRTDNSSQYISWPTRLLSWAICEDSGRTGGKTLKISLFCELFVVLISFGLICFGRVDYFSILLFVVGGSYMPCHGSLRPACRAHRVRGQLTSTRTREPVQVGWHVLPQRRSEDVLMLILPHHQKP